MKKFNFDTKELVETLSYTTATSNRQRFADCIINGRRYRKYGDVQALTLVGNLYKDHEGNKCLMVGMSKQHPNDNKCNKEIAYEEANKRSLENPDIIFYTVPERLTLFNFRKMMEWYIDGIDVQFIKTKEEKELMNK